MDSFSWRLNNLEQNFVVCNEIQVLERKDLEDWVSKLNSRLSFYRRISAVKNAWKNPCRKCECISSCYFPISWNSWKNSLRKTSLFVRFGHLLTGLLKYVSPIVTTLHEWVNNFLCFIWNNINEKVGKLV